MNPRATDQMSPTSKWLIAGVAALAYLVGSVAVSNSRDRDNDHLPDQWEQRYGISTTEKSGKQDPDHDRLTNRREHELRTHPRKRDTDGDGYDDGTEVRKGTNPRKARDHPGFPNPASTGVPPGWEPKQTRDSDLHVTKAGAVVSDLLLVEADLLVEAPNVTIRRVKLQGGQINNTAGDRCANGMTIEDTTLEPAPGEDSVVETEGAVSSGGYTARRVELSRRAEGFRDGGASEGCGPVRIEDSFVKIVTPPGRCDLHSDGIQGYDGPALTVINTTIDFPACGTAPFFVPSGQGNETAKVKNLLVMGGGYPFRLGVPGSVSGLKIVNGSWEYGPVDVRCSALGGWNGEIVEIDSDYQIARGIRPARCEGEGN